jgi:hypothetical protein
MADGPKRVKLLSGEEVIRKSTGIGEMSAVLYFDEAGKALTKKPYFGHAYLTNQRLILEVYENPSGWQNAAYNVLGIPTVLSLSDIALFFKSITEVSKSTQTRAGLVKLSHSQSDAPSPIYFNVQRLDEWLRTIQVFMQQSRGDNTPLSSAPVPPPPSPNCPTCGSPLSYIQQYQRWYCYKEQKYV